MGLNDKDTTPVVLNGQEFTYNNPDISVQTSGRFVTHEVVGGVTVRQKVGEDPVEISISGACTTEEANFIDNLRTNDVVSLSSHRYDAATAQVASSSTDPFQEGGAVSPRTGKWTHRFSVNLVEVQT